MIQQLMMACDNCIRLQETYCTMHDARNAGVMLIDTSVGTPFGKEVHSETCGSMLQVSEHHHPVITCLKWDVM